VSVFYLHFLWPYGFNILQDMPLAFSQISHGWLLLPIKAVKGYVDLLVKSVFDLFFLH